MRAQNPGVAAAGAAGALGGARQQKPPREWYTIVVYEKRSAKKVVLYLDRTETFVFTVPADVNIGNIAVIMRRWRVSDRTVAYSASIHVKNLAELLHRYAPDVALAVAEVVANAELNVKHIDVV